MESSESNPENTGSVGVPVAKCGDVALAIHAHSCRVLRDGVYEYISGGVDNHECLNRIVDAVRAQCGHRHYDENEDHGGHSTFTVVVCPQVSVRAATRSGMRCVAGEAPGSATWLGRAVDPFATAVLVMSSAFVPNNLVNRAPRILLTVCNDKAGSPSKVSKLSSDEASEVDAYIAAFNERVQATDRDGMVASAGRVLAAEAAALALYRRESAARASANNSIPCTPKRVHAEVTLTAATQTVYEYYDADGMSRKMVEGAWTAVGASLLLLGGIAERGVRDTVCRYMCGVVCDDYAHEAGLVTPSARGEHLAEARTRTSKYEECLRGTAEIWSRRLLLNGCVVNARSILARVPRASLNDFVTALVRVRIGNTLDDMICTRVADFGTDAYMEINPGVPWRGPAGYADDMSLCACTVHDIVDMATDEVEMEVLNISAHIELAHREVEAGLAGRYVVDVMLGAAALNEAGGYGDDDMLRVPFGVVAWMFGTTRYRAWDRLLAADLEEFVSSYHGKQDTYLTALHFACADIVCAAVGSTGWVSTVINLLAPGAKGVHDVGDLSAWREVTCALLDVAAEDVDVVRCAGALDAVQDLSARLRCTGEDRPTAQELAGATQALLGAVMEADIAGVPVAGVYRRVCAPLVAAFVLGGLCDTAKSGARLRAEAERIYAE